MFFTQEDYKKIQQWLTKNSVKDTEFNEANIPFNGNEIVSIVQGNQNKKVFLKDLIAQIFNLGVSDFVNITDKYDAPNISLEEAIRLIPSRARKEGQVITFLDREDHWHIYQFKGVLNQWNVLDQWEDLFDWEKLIIDSILPDEEDLTKSLPDNNGNSYLSLKDRKYEPDNYSGLGRVILRKNIVEIEDPIYGKVKKNILYQDMINKENTIYEIRYDFDLNGEEITIPEGCILDFQGGSLNNGTVIGNNTYINAGICKIFNLDTNFKGTFNIKNPYCEWFGGNVNETKQEIYIQKCLSAFNNVLLLPGKYYISSPIILTSYQSIKGTGSNINGTEIHKTTNIKASNIPITISNVDLNEDAVIIIVPKEDDHSGNNQYNHVSIKNLCIYGDSKNEYGILASDGRYSYYTSLFIYGCRNGIRVEYSWMQTFTNIRMAATYSTTIPFEDSCGFRINELAPYSGYTTIKFRDCYVQSFHIGYKLHNCTYGVFDNCACDNCIDTAYYLYNNHGIVVNSNGNEKTKLTEKEYSAAYYINKTEIVLNGCYSTMDGANSESDNKYLYKIVENSKVTLNSYIHTGDSGVKIKVSGYSMLLFNGERDIIDNDSIFELSSKSSVVWFYNGNIRKLTEDSKEHALISEIATKTNFRDIIPEASISSSGLMPAGFVPANNKPSNIDDANDIKNGSYYVSGNLTNLPDNRWGIITSCRVPSGNGYQIFICYSDNSLIYYRTYGTSWSVWRVIRANSVDTKISGIFDDRPRLSSVGFTYFCTDRQTIEGATNGIMIYHKGNNVWVDALGRVVS